MFTIAIWRFALHHHLELIKSHNGTKWHLEHVKILETKAKNFSTILFTNVLYILSNISNYHEIQCCNNNGGSISCQSFDMAKANIGSLLHLKAFIPKKFKLTKIAIMQMLGSVEDEQIFPILSFMKSKLKNYPKNVH
jgi:hypothetical protein